MFAFIFKDEIASGRAAIHFHEQSLNRGFPTYYVHQKEDLRATEAALLQLVQADYPNASLIHDDAAGMVYVITFSIPKPAPKSEKTPPAAEKAPKPAAEAPQTAATASAEEPAPAAPAEEEARPVSAEVPKAPEPVAQTEPEITAKKPATGRQVFIIVGAGEVVPGVMTGRRVDRSSGEKRVTCLIDVAGEVYYRAPQEVYETREQATESQDTHAARLYFVLHAAMYHKSGKREEDAFLQKARHPLAIQKRRGEVADLKDHQLTVTVYDEAGSNGSQVVEVLRYDEWLPKYRYKLMPFSVDEVADLDLTPTRKKPGRKPKQDLTANF